MLTRCERADPGYPDLPIHDGRYSDQSDRSGADRERAGRRCGDSGAVCGRRNACIGLRANRLGGVTTADLVVLAVRRLHWQESIAEQGVLRDASESDVAVFLSAWNRNNNRNGEDPVVIRQSAAGVYAA